MKEDKRLNIINALKDHSVGISDGQIGGSGILEIYDHDLDQSEFSSVLIERLLNAALPRWIPVSEQLPEPFEGILCMGKYGAFVSYYASPGQYFDFTEGMSKEHFLRDVIAWMPLPENPLETPS